VMYVNHVTDTKVQPFTGEEAINAAQQLVHRDEVQKALVNSLTAFRAAAKDKIKYAAGYAPPPTPAAGATPAATAGAATVPAKTSAPAAQ